MAVEPASLVPVLSMDDRVWDAGTFSQNRDRLLAADVAGAFFEQVRLQAERAGLLSGEHFSVDGTLIEAWAGQKSLRRVDGDDDPPPAGRNPMVNFHGEKRANDTHVSTTDPEAMLARKTRGSETKLAYRSHSLTESRNGLIVRTQVTHAYGNAETHAALQMLEHLPGAHRVTCGADKGFDTAEFERESQIMNVVAHVARKITGSAIPVPRARGTGYQISQRRRKLVEEPFGWIKATMDNHRLFLRCGLYGCLLCFVILWQR